MALTIVQDKNFIVYGEIEKNSGSGAYTLKIRICNKYGLIAADESFVVTKDTTLVVNLANIFVGSTSLLLLKLLLDDLNGHVMHVRKTMPKIEVYWSDLIPCEYRIPRKNDKSYLAFLLCKKFNASWDKLASKMTHLWGIECSV